VLIQLQCYQIRTSYGSGSISDLESLLPEIDDMLLRLSDIMMLLQTLCYHNNTVFMIFIDNDFHTSDEVQEQLQILNHTREERGVRN